MTDRTKGVLVGLGLAILVWANVNRNAGNTILLAVVGLALLTGAGWLVREAWRMRRSLIRRDRRSPEDLVRELREFDK